jgi:hypothetical protein
VTTWPFDDLRGKVVVMDPPYQGSQACYNDSRFDYHKYWEFVGRLRGVAKAVLLFDSIKNMPSPEGCQTRAMVVNGAREGIGSA